MENVLKRLFDFQKFEGNQDKEFYAAVEVGINPQYVFEVDIDEYLAAVQTVGDKKIRPTELIFDGEKFNIIRTYEKVGGIMELTVSL